MRVTVLGSGTLVPDDDRRSAAHLVETDGARILLDCGFGTVHGFDRHRIEWAGITHVALTHFHADHVADVAPLLFALKHGLRPPRTLPLVLLGPPGLHTFLEAQAAALGDFVLDPGFPFEVFELRRDSSWDDPDGRFRLRAHPTPHTAQSVAYRVETGDGAVGYTGDTGPDPDVARFLTGADVLISECSLPDEEAIETHLSPGHVAELARISAPRLLLLTHVYPLLDPARAPDLVRAAGWGGDVRISRDGTRIELEPGSEPHIAEG